MSIGADVPEDESGNIGGFSTSGDGCVSAGDADIDDAAVDAGDDNDGTGDGDCDWSCLSLFLPKNLAPGSDR